MVVPKSVSPDMTQAKGLQLQLLFFASLDLICLIAHEWASSCLKKKSNNAASSSLSLIDFNEITFLWRPAFIGGKTMITGCKRVILRLRPTFFLPTLLYLNDVHGPTDSRRQTMFGLSILLEGISLF